MVFDRICFEGFLRPAGWTRLPSVRRITDLLISGQKIESIKFEPFYFLHPLSVLASENESNIVTNALEDIVGNESRVGRTSSKSGSELIFYTIR